MLKQTVLLLITGLSLQLAAQSISLNTLDEVIGEDWTGKLTYLDYTSNEEVSLLVNLEVTKIKEGTYQFAYSYPNEPKANSKTKIRISSDGTKISGNKITKVEKTEEGLLIIHAESKGSDNNEKAMLYFTYTIGERLFSTKKEVKLAGDDDRFLRNEYRLSR